MLMVTCVSLINKAPLEEGKEGGVIKGCKWVVVLWQKVVTSALACMFNHTSRARWDQILGAIEALDLVTAAALLHTRGVERSSVVSENLDCAWSIYKAGKMPVSSVLYDVISSGAPSHGP
eukprot:11302509-Ditylum_brightwellii.AAC.1